MLGRDHALSGAVAFAALAPFAVHLTAAQLAAGTVLTAGAALLPDFDEPGSTIARSAGFLTRGFACLVRFAARGHRHGTHSLLGAGVFTLLAWLGAVTEPGRLLLLAFLALMLACALRAVPVMRGHLADTAGLGMAAGLCFWHSGLVLVPACVALGVLSHIAGDAATHGGCPLLWPFSRRDFHDSPVLFTTGKFFESRIAAPALAAGLVLALAWDAGLIGWLSVHTSGHLAR
jgi:membrane-bound metal-dependent hydrolase YbcI (DUF457 family)